MQKSPTHPTLENVIALHQIECKHNAYLKMAKSYFTRHKQKTFALNDPISTNDWMFTLIHSIINEEETHEKKKTPK